MQTINFDNFNFEPKKKFLDLGCGQGRHCFGAYMSANIDVFGFDMSLSDIKVAEKNFDEFDENNNSKLCKFGVANATKLPFADETFDYIICSEVLEHILDYQEALKEISRVLKSNGKMERVYKSDEAFKYIVSGIGLFGIVTEITLKLKKWLLKSFF